MEKVIRNRPLKRLRKELEAIRKELAKQFDYLLLAKAETLEAELIERGSK